MVGEATLDENLLEDGETPPLHTQFPSQYLPPVDAQGSPDSPPRILLKDVSDTAHLASESNLPGDRFTAFDDQLFGI